uniref:Akirin 1 n=1 Tax=Leptobrachium leishanense TaxID=445787 RepID=A0A8C5MUV1_9ANUR
MIYSLWQSDIPAYVGERKVCQDTPLLLPLQWKRSFGDVTDASVGWLPGRSRHYCTLREVQSRRVLQSVRFSRCRFPYFYVVFFWGAGCAGRSMACGATLKRSMEFEALLSPQSPKRRRCVPLPGSPNTPTTRGCGHRPESQPTPPPALSPMGTDLRLTPEQIFHNLRQEYSRFQRRRQLVEAFNQSEAGSSNEAQASCSSLSAPGSPGSLAKKDQPSFSLRQVGFLCERLLKDHEDRIREEYEQILNTKLEEQYESFVKFTHDQIMRRYGARPASYVS